MQRMAKSAKASASICMAAFLLLFFFNLTNAGQPSPASSPVTLSKTQHEALEMVKVNVEESCEGVGEEECLMRRTLAAHLDYIYTQKQKP